MIGDFNVLSQEDEEALHQIVHLLCDLEASFRVILALFVVESCALVIVDLQVLDLIVCLTKCSEGSQQVVCVTILESVLVEEVRLLSLLVLKGLAKYFDLLEDENPERN